MKDTFGFELESAALQPELEQELGLHGVGRHGALASEVRRRPSLSCPQPTRATVSGFPRYSNAVSTLPATDQAKVRNLAQLIAGSFQRRCQPFRAVRLVGHADNDPIREQRDPGFMLRISQQRAQAVRQALERLINNRAILSQVRWEVQGAAASQLVVPNPRTEVERRRNRRVEISLPGKASERDCSGWESDPQSFAKRAAEHYLARLGIPSFEVRSMKCSSPPNWVCDVEVDTGAETIFVKVSLSPADKLVRVASPGHMVCFYSYRCLPSGQLIFDNSTCPRF